MAQITFGLAAITPSPSRSTIRRSNTRRGHARPTVTRPVVRPHRTAAPSFLLPARSARTRRRTGEHAVLGLLSAAPLTLTAGLPGLPESAGLRGSIPATEPKRVAVRPGLTGLSGA